MRLVGWLIAAVAFVAPLAVFGELSVWVVEEPLSYLVWDEAMEGPGDDGVTAPGPGPELADGKAMFGMVWLPAVLTGWVGLAIRIAQQSGPASAN